MTDWYDHITVVEAVRAGKPITRGTRITVDLIMDRLADGWSLDDILVAYPRLKRDDVLAAIAFATEVVREEEYVGVDKARA